MAHRSALSREASRLRASTASQSAILAASSNGNDRVLDMSHRARRAYPSAAMTFGFAAPSRVAPPRSFSPHAPSPQCKSPSGTSSSRQHRHMRRESRRTSSRASPDKQGQIAAVTNQPGPQAYCDPGGTDHLTGGAEETVLRLAASTSWISAIFCRRLAPLRA